MNESRDPGEVAIRVALEKYGTVTEAARQLGVSRQTLYSWMKRHDVLGRNSRAKAA